MNTEEAWEKFKKDDSEMISKSSTAAMLEAILSQQNALNVKVDQILKEESGSPGEGADGELPPEMPPMGGEGGAPEMPPMGGAPEGEETPAEGENVESTMPPMDANALLGGMPEGLGGNAPLPGPGGAPENDLSGASEGLPEDEAPVEGAPDLGSLGLGQGTGDRPFSFFGDAGNEDDGGDDNLIAVADAITTATDVDIQLGMTQVLQDYLMKKKGDAAAPMDAIADVLGGAPDLEAPVADEASEEGDLDEVLDELLGGAPAPDEGMADIPEGIEGATESSEDVPAEGDIADILDEADKEEDEKDKEKNPFAKSKSKDDDSEDEEESDDEDDYKDKEKDDDKSPFGKEKDDDKSEDETEDKPEDKSKDRSENKSDDDEEVEDSLPEDEADAVIEIDESPMADADIAAIEKVVGTKMSDLIAMLREILGDEADTDVNPMIAHGTDDLSPTTDPFFACNDAGVETLTRSIDDLMQDHLKGLRGNDGKMYKVIKSESQIKEERIDRFKRSLSSKAVYHMTAGQVLDAMRGLEENGVESVKKSFAHPYDIIIRALDCSVGPETTDKFMRSGGDINSESFRKGTASDNFDLKEYAKEVEAFKDPEVVNLANAYISLLKGIYGLDAPITYYKDPKKGQLPKEYKNLIYDGSIFNFGKDEDRKTYNKLVLDELAERRKKNKKYNIDNDVLNSTYDKVIWDPMFKKVRDLITISQALGDKGINMADTNLFANPISRIGNILRFSKRARYSDRMMEKAANALGMDLNDKDQYYKVIDALNENAFSAMKDNDLNLNRYIPRGPIANHWALIDGDKYGGNVRKYIDSLPTTKKYRSGFALGPAIKHRLPLIDSISGIYRIGPDYDYNSDYVPLDVSSIVERELKELGENAPVKDFGSFIHNINKNNFVYGGVGKKNYVDLLDDDDDDDDDYNDSSNDEPSSQTQNTKKENKQENKQENTPKNKMANLFPTGLGDGY